MEKLYVNEIRPSGEVSTVSLFYSRCEAEDTSPSCVLFPIEPIVVMK